MFPDLTRDDVFRIETRRLWLRWPRAADAAAIVRLAGERAVAEMTARIPHPIDPIGVEAFVLSARRDNAEGRALVMAITPRSSPASLIGVVGLEPDPDAAGGHLGYWLGMPYWGQGFMTEAAEALAESYFAYANGTELMSSAQVGNIGSRRVLEKCGFVWTGSGLQAFPARGGPLPVDRFRLDRRRWLDRRQDFAHASRAEAR